MSTATDMVPPSTPEPGIRATSGIAATAEAATGTTRDHDAPSGITPVTDGRHLRRERNRSAVVESLLALYREGVLEPSTDQIAARAGVSARSLFRYFTDVDDLARTAIAHQYEHVAPILNVELDPTLPFEDRVVAFVTHRLDLCHAMAGVGLVARARESFQPLIAEELGRSRRFLRRRAAEVFATELAALAAAGVDAEAMLDAADTVCSFESYHLFEVRPVDADHIRRTWTAAVTRLLTPLAPPT